MTRTSKGQKGQFFTPRYVVDFCVRLVQLQGGERVIDPACGSGAFLTAAIERGAGSVLGYEIDSRAVRIAKLLLLSRGADAESIHLGDGLQLTGPQSADVVLTNPPFAGEINDPRRLSEFELATSRGRVERDILFLERSLKALRPGGKIAIVLPHNKFAGKATRHIRAWLLEHADVLAVIGLGRNTFLPHTHQKANVLLARRRSPGANGEPKHMFFAQSRQDGKDSRGRSTGISDLNAILEQYLNARPQTTVLDADLTLAPERHAAPAAAGVTSSISSIAQVASSYCKPGEPGPFVALDTTHALDGWISSRPLAAVGALKSHKKTLRAGDVIVSRLRPYLRQIAYVDAALVDRFAGAQLCCSTEFYVLRGDGDLAFLIPFLLSEPVQTLLAKSQEGGHHPRVPLGVVQNIAVPSELLRERESLSKSFQKVIQTFRDGERAREALVSRSETARQ